MNNPYNNHNPLPTTKPSNQDNKPSPIYGINLITPMLNAYVLKDHLTSPKVKEQPFVTPVIKDIMLIVFGHLKKTKYQNVHFAIS